MKRRGFVGFVLGAAALRAHAQQTRMRRIGVLSLGNPEPYWMHFRDALHELGYIEGRNIQIDLRAAGGDPKQLAEHAAKRATSEIPIVLVSSGDAVASGLVTSLSHPGGNVTGVSVNAAEAATKSLEFLREILPSLTRIAVLLNPADSFNKLLLERL